RPQHGPRLDESRRDVALARSIGGSDGVLVMPDDADLVGLLRLLRCRRAGKRGEDQHKLRSFRNLSSPVSGRKFMVGCGVAPRDDKTTESPRVPPERLVRFRSEGPFRGALAPRGAPPA